MPKHRHPFPGGSSIIVRATTQFQLAIEKPDQFRIAKPRDDLVFLFVFMR
jgi:hypothetical protein